eukprot:15450848-Alexandrium_andersonii.AAC.2
MPELSSAAPQHGNLHAASGGLHTLLVAPYTQFEVYVLYVHAYFLIVHMPGCRARGRLSCWGGLRARLPAVDAL